MLLSHAILMLALLFSAGVASAQEQSNDAAPAGASDDSVHFGWADVLRVDPVHDAGRPESTHEECTDQPVQHTQHRSNNAGGTLLGAIVGGVLGHTVGKGDGRKAATVAGAVVGGAVGNGVSSNNDDSYTSTETRCVQVPDDNGQNQPRVVGYDVEYRYRGEVYMSRLNYDPGDRLRVRVSVLPAE